MKKTKKKAAKSRAKTAARAQAKKTKAPIKAKAKTKAKAKPKAKAPARKPARPAPKLARTAPSRPTGADDAYEEAQNYKARATADPTLPDTRDTDEDAGDLEGLSRHELSDSESVAELVDEGQDFEAEEIEAIEEAPDPDQGEVPAPRAPRGRPTSFKNRNRL